MSSDSKIREGKSVRFRLWLLLIYAIGGAIGYSTIVLLGRYPPSREYWGDDERFRIWIWIVVSGAGMGGMIYFINLFILRRKARCG